MGDTMGSRDGPPPSRGRVLVAEDNPINQEIARAFLDAAGYACALADDGQAAVDLARGAGPGGFVAALIDIEMPVMDGLTAMRLLRAEQPGLALVAMTGHGGEAERRACAEAGALAHVCKPFDQPALLAALEAGLAAVPSRTAASSPVAQPLPAPAPRPGAGLDLDRLVCFDVAALLGILGDPSFVSRLLLQFRDGEGGLGRAIATALSEGDREQAARLAHRLKGVAGNLRAQEVFVSAGALEAALAETPPAADDWLTACAEALGGALDQAVADIDAARREAAPVFAGVPADAVPAAPLRHRLRALGRLLRDQDLAADDLWEALAPALAARNPDLSAQIGDAIAALRYPEARRLTLKLVGALT